MDFSKYKIKKVKNKTLYNGRQITILDFTRKDKKKIDRKELGKICFELRDDLRSVYDEGLISISIQYPERWYSGSVSKLSNDKLNIFSMDQYDEFDEDDLTGLQQLIGLLPMNRKALTLYSQL